MPTRNFYKMELENIGFEVGSFININSCFENYFTSGHSYAKKKDEVCFSED